MLLRWTTPTPDLLFRLAMDMRASDMEEVWLSAGLMPLDALTMLVNASDAVFVALVENEPVYIFGGKSNSQLDAQNGTCWGLGTTWLDRHGITFAKLSRRGLVKLWQALPQVQRFACRIWICCPKTLAWAKWLGATLGATREAGLKGGVFVPYTIERT